MQQTNHRRHGLSSCGADTPVRESREEEGGRFCNPTSVQQRPPNLRTNGTGRKSLCHFAPEGIRWLALNREDDVTVTQQQSIPKMQRGAIRAALMLAVMFSLGMASTQSAEAQTFTVLHSFPGSPYGETPYAGLVQGTARQLYGTTNAGGNFFAGEVFRLSKNDTATRVYSFTGGADGGFPYAGLVRDAVGNLYGNTYGGGSGSGTVFKVTKTGNETVMHAFAGGTTDGCQPSGGLLWDQAANLYGTTEGCGAFGVGIVFRLSKTGQETVLHSFGGGPTDGQNPDLAGLLMDAKGNLYGVTAAGGASGEGVVYRLSSSGIFTVLHSFAGGTTDGCRPNGTPAMDAKGNLYGTTYACGSSNYGIVWKVSQNGTETVLHDFAGGSSDGANPAAGVIMDRKGNLYGITGGGGGNGCFMGGGCGVVFTLSRIDTLTLLHSFAGLDGNDPIGGLMMDAEGNIYGTTDAGGGHKCNGGCGTVWKLTP